MHCVFIHGPVASGKLTVARALHQRTGWALHHNHLAVDAALSLFPFGSAGFVELRAELWHAAFRSAARHGQTFIFTFAPERTVARELIDALVLDVTSHAGQVLFIELTCDEAEIERRIVAADRSRHLKLTDVDAYRELRAAGAFAGLSMPAPLLRIASDAQTPEEAAIRIERAVLQAVQDSRAV